MWPFSGTFLMSGWHNHDGIPMTTSGSNCNTWVTSPWWKRMWIKLILLLSWSFPHDDHQAQEKVNWLFVRFPPSQWFPHVLASTAHIFCLDFLILALSASSSPRDISIRWMKSQIVSFLTGMLRRQHFSVSQEKLANKSEKKRNSFCETDFFSLSSCHHLVTRAAAMTQRSWPWWCFCTSGGRSSHVVIMYILDTMGVSIWIWLFMMSQYFNGTHSHSLKSTIFLKHWSILRFGNILILQRTFIQSDREKSQKYTFRCLF